MTAKTTEELWSILVDVLEDFDEADQKGERLSRDAIAALCARRTEAIAALMVSLRVAATVSPGQRISLSRRADLNLGADGR